MSFVRFLSSAAVIASLLVIQGCDFNSSDSATATKSEPEVSLTILHINDHHSHIAGDDSIALTIDGKLTTVKDVGNMARTKTAFDSLSAGKSNVLKLHAGDATVGTLYYTLFKGEADAKLMNSICFDAMAVGNHEFDESDTRLKSFIDALHSDVSCKTAVLSANIKPAIGTALAPNKVDDYIKPYTIKTVDGVKVAVVGLTIKGKTQNSSSPLATTVFEDELVAAQRTIDELKAQNITRIVLLSHIGYPYDVELASKLTDVDVIIGGDSHTLMGDFSAYNITSNVKDYPSLHKNKNGHPVCVAQAWEYNKAVGELAVTFTETGSIKQCSGTPHVIVSDNITRKDATNKDYTVKDAELSTYLNSVSSSNGKLLFATANATAKSILDSYKSQVDVLKNEQIGVAAELLCHERVPGGGLSKTPGCSAATSSRGSDIANIVSQAFLAQSLTSEIAIQNGGGVRIDVPAGSITVGTAYTLLPFANTLTELSMTGAEIKQVLEEALDSATKTGGSTGSYPYAAGLRWNIDLTQPVGSRISNLEHKAKGTTNWVPLDTSRTYKVVSNSFTAQGQDGYLTFKTVSDRGDATNTYLDYAQSFVDYVKKVGTLNKLPTSEYSTQVFINASGIQQ